MIQLSKISLWYFYTSFQLPPLPCLPNDAKPSTQVPCPAPPLERHAAKENAASSPTVPPQKLPPPVHRPLRLMHRTTVATDSSESDEATPVAHNPMDLPRYGYPWETINNLTELRCLYPVEWEHAVTVSDAMFTFSLFRFPFVFPDVEAPIVPDGHRHEQR